MFEKFKEDIERYNYFYNKTQLPSRMNEENDLIKQSYLNVIDCMIERNKEQIKILSTKPWKETLVPTATRAIISDREFENDYLQEQRKQIEEYETR